MKKKSQVTVFIIIAVLIVAGIVLFVVVSRTDLTKKTIEPEVAPIYSFVENCIEETGYDIVWDVGETGGYFVSPDNSMDNGIAYYLYEKSNLMPSKTKIEKEISLGIKNMLFACVKDFVNFQDFEITENEIQVETKVAQNKVSLDVVYPLSITKGSKTYFFKDFKDIEIPVRLGLIYDSVEELMIDQMTHTESICIGCVYDLAKNNNLYIQTIDYEDGVVIFTVKDKISKLGDEIFIFNFANKYEEVSLWELE